MKILVLVRQVPDPTVVAFERDGSLQPNVGRIVNDYDSHAIETALTIAAAGEPNANEVVALSVGPAHARDAIARALAMGADRGVLLVCDAQLDALAVARLIASELAAGGYDLVLAGQETSDGASGTVGPLLAGLHGWPLVSNVVDLQLADKRLVLEREVEEGRQQVGTRLPAVVCVLSAASEPRYPSLKGIMAARKKPLDVREVDAQALAPAVRWGQPYAEERPAAGVMIAVEQVGLDDAVRQVIELLDERRLMPRGA